MTQFTEEQLKGALERTSTKLQAFYDTLADDERLVLDLALDRLIAGGAPDTQAHMFNHRQESAETLPEEPNTLIPYRINGPTLSTQITPTIRVSN